MERVAGGHIVLRQCQTSYKLEIEGERDWRPGGERDSCTTLNGVMELRKERDARATLEPKWWIALLVQPFVEIGRLGLWPLEIRGRVRC